jgi:hypothetical protein
MAEEKMNESRVVWAVTDQRRGQQNSLVEFRSEPDLGQN